MNTDRIMRNMMQSMGFGMPFGMFDDIQSHGNAGHFSQMNNNPMSAMLPFGFAPPISTMMMMNPFQEMQQAMSMANNGGGFSYCSSSMTSYTTDEQGRPQVYQQSQEVKSGPNGVKETKSAIKDSRTGQQEISIGHHLRDKAHIKKRSKNAYTGEEEQAEDLVNIEEGETEAFAQDWAREARNFSTGSYNNHLSNCRSNRLALTSSEREDGPSQPINNSTNEKPAMKTKKKKKSKLWKL